MRFVDREPEIRLLGDALRLSRRRLHGVLVYGPRRIGKTELVTRFARRRKHLYFFVYAYKTPQALLADFEGELRRAGFLGERETVRSWEDAVDVLFERGKGRVVIFDEFQNFRSVYPAMFSILQRKIDASRSSPVLAIYVGSAVGMMREVFEGSKSPLYGRIQSKLKVDPLGYEHVRALCRDLGYRRETEAVQLYSLFGGYPKYYSAIEEFRLGGAPVLDLIDRFYLSEQAIFASEVPDILREEFGRRRGVYYTVIEAVATGHTKISEIASYVGLATTSVTRHLNELVEYHHMLVRRAPIGEKRPARRGVYAIANPAFRFWFRTIHRNLSLYESREFETLRRMVREDLPAFVGRGFEEICLELLRRMNRAGRLPVRCDEIGTWWHKDQEIDALGIQKRGDELLACEVKWSENVNAESILAALKAKLAHVPIRRAREHCVVIARSFSRKTKEATLISVDEFSRYF
jgi:AAA+ ATPase superfamily predicted ATPase